MLAHEAGKPHVWHFHERVMAHLDRPFHRPNNWVRDWIDRHTSVVVVPSEALREWSDKYVPKERLKVVRNGVVGERGELPEARRCSRNLQPVRVSVVGRLSEAKGCYDALRALAKVRETGVNAEMRFVGEADEVTEVEMVRLTRELKLESAVSFAGYVADALPEIAQCDIFLMPSHYESFGRATVEAMALAKPVVATLGGATSEIVQDGFTGLLCDPGQPTQLADAMLWMLDHPDEADRLRKSAWISAHGKYSRSLFADRIRTIYDEALKPDTDSRSSNS